MPAQTLTEIRSLLADAGLAPLHRFGQNFLIDLNLMRKLVAAADVRAEDVVLEVGPGTGSLTESLLECGARVVAVEIDRGLAALLRERLGENSRLTLVQADILSSKHQINPLVMKLLNETQPREGGTRKLVANLPFQVATPLLIDLLRAATPIGQLTCTIQKEVGERLAADPRTDAYGPASVICQSLAEIELIAIMPPTAFWPRPKVESLMLTLRPLPADQVDVVDVDDFVDFVHQGFNQRRKMLRRMVREWKMLDVLAAFKRAGISPESRPEEVTPHGWRAFHRAVHEQRSAK